MDDRVERPRGIRRPVGNSQAAREYDENAERLTNLEKYADAPLPAFSPKTVTSEQPVEITVKQPIVMLEPKKDRGTFAKGLTEEAHFRNGNGNVEPAAGGVCGAATCRRGTPADEDRRCCGHAAGGESSVGRMAALSPPRARFRPRPGRPDGEGTYPGTGAAASYQKAPPPQQTPRRV